MQPLLSFVKIIYSIMLCLFFCTITGLAQTTYGIIAGTQGGNTNSYFGIRAGEQNTEISNSFFGYHSGRYTNSSFNSFFGSYTGYKNIDGVSNTFIGMGVGYENISGSNNSYFGYRSGRNNTIGNNNCFLGYHSGYNNVDGNGNLFIGLESGYSNINGSNNTFLGNNSGKHSIGNSNIFIGFEAGYYEVGNNKLYIANSSTTNPLIYGDFESNRVDINGTLALVSNTGITTLKNVQHLHEGVAENFVSISVEEDSSNPVLISETGRISIGSEGICLRHTTTIDSTFLIVDGVALKYGDAFWQSASDKRLKKSIKPLQKSLSKFLNIDFYSYQYKKTNQTRFGIMAQEMKDIYPESMGKLIEEDGTEYLTFNPNNLFYTGLKVTQEIGELTLEQETKIKQLEKENEDLKSELEAIKAALKSNGIDVTQNDNNNSLKQEVPHLLQNKPNPFIKTTIIPYFLIQENKSAVIVIYDLSGKTIEKHQLPIKQGAGNLKLGSMKKNVEKGAYSYSLIVDGNLIDTKKMLWF